MNIYAIVMENEKNKAAIEQSKHRLHNKPTLKGCLEFYEGQDLDDKMEVMAVKLLYDDYKEAKKAEDVVSLTSPDAAPVRRSTRRRSNSTFGATNSIFDLDVEAKVSKSASQASLDQRVLLFC